MKKTIPQLALRKETVRVLVDADLARVVGRELELFAQSGRKECEAAAALAAPPE